VEEREGKGGDGREGQGMGRWEGRGKNDLTHPLSQIPGYTTDTKNNETHLAHTLIQ